MHRRTFIVGGLAGLGIPVGAEARQAGIVRRIGLVVRLRSLDSREIRDALKQGLREQGYAEPSIEIQAAWHSGRNRRETTN
jgi:hypothetical protein